MESNKHFTAEEAKQIGRKLEKKIVNTSLGLTVLFLPIFYFAGVIMSYYIYLLGRSHAASVLQFNLTAFEIALYCFFSFFYASRICLKKVQENNINKIFFFPWYVLILIVPFSFVSTFLTTGPLAVIFFIPFVIELAICTLILSVIFLVFLYAWLLNKKLIAIFSLIAVTLFAGIMINYCITNYLKPNPPIIKINGNMID